MSPISSKTMGEAIDLKAIQSEGRNPNSFHIDAVSTESLCKIINDEDKTVAAAVTSCLPVVAAAVDVLTERVRAGGRVIYVGAGTSGRLGVLDASELPPTFSAPPEQFIALIAGGDDALRNAKEGAEDDVEQAVHDLRDVTLDGHDSLIGIAASGRTPYVLSCLEYAKSLGCLTVGIACSSPSAMLKGGNVDHMIEAVTGAEVLTGSTRMKAGTATKLVLNMLSTAVQIKLGKTYGNLMVDVKATNLKLKQRAAGIIREACGPSCSATDEELLELLEKCGGSVKLAIVAQRLRIPPSEANGRLQATGGFLSQVFKDQGNATLNESSGDDHTKFVLCVDGGGSKCAAFVLGTNGEIGISASDTDGCNVTTVGPSVATATIVKTVKEAMAGCPSIGDRDTRSVPFAKVWIGLAGFDRPQVSAVLTSRLRAMFGPMPEMDFVVSNDLELLAASAGATDEQSICVLVAGTGSISMAFKKGAHRYHKIGRSGGWGPLLGDDGSGFDVGRQALRFILEMQDMGASEPNKDPLDDAVLKHLSGNARTGDAGDIISSIMVTEASGKRDPKRKIAEVARIVLEKQDCSPTAAEIVAKSTASLTQLVQKVVRCSALNPSKAVLVLTGGMMQNSPFQSKVVESIVAGGLNFGRVEVVGVPGFVGAQHLLKSLDQDTS